MLGGQAVVFCSESGRSGVVFLSQSRRSGVQDVLFLSQSKRCGGQRCHVSSSEWKVGRLVRRSSWTFTDVLSVIRLEGEEVWGSSKIYTAG